MPCGTGVVRIEKIVSDATKQTKDNSLQNTLNVWSSYVSSPRCLCFGFSTYVCAYIFMYLWHFNCSPSIHNNCFHSPAPLTLIAASFSSLICLWCSLHSGSWFVMWSVCKQFSFFSQAVSFTFISDSNFLYFPECFLTGQRSGVWLSISNKKIHHQSTKQIYRCR